MANDLSVTIRPIFYFEINLGNKLFRAVEEVALIQDRSVKRVLEDALDQYCDLTLHGVTTSAFSANNQLGFLQRVGLLIKRKSRSQKSSLGVTVTVGLSEYLVERWHKVAVRKDTGKTTIFELALRSYTQRCINKRVERGED